MTATPLSIPVTGDIAISALAFVPKNPTACLVFAHGAGAGMNHPFIAAVSEGLARRDIATLRYQFPYMDKGSRRTDPPKLCHDTVRAAVIAAHKLLPNVPLFAGGKSFGGRMTSQAQAVAPLPHVLGLCFFGFPLHVPKTPSTIRAEHLAEIDIPMLFLQGTRDQLANLTLMKQVVAGLKTTVALNVIEHADHSFHVLARSGMTDEQVMASMLDDVTAWAGAVAKE